MSQVCKICEIDKPLSEYYTRNKTQHFRRCKECILANLPKTPKVPRGVDRLAPEVRASIVAALADRRQKIKNIAEEHGIYYPTLCKWIRENRFQQNETETS